MSYRVLILDDNYSFIDTLKMRWKSYPFYYDTSFQYKEVIAYLEEQGPIINNHNYDKIKSFINFIEQEDAPSKEQTEIFLQENKDYYSLKNDPKKILNESGYFMVIIEYYAQNNINATQFVQSIIEQNMGFTYNNFIILTSQPKIVQQLNNKNLGSKKIHTFDKNTSQQQLHDFIGSRVEQLQIEINNIQKHIQLFEKYIQPHISVITPSVKKAKLKTKILTSNTNSTRTKQSTQSTKAKSTIKKQSSTKNIDSVNKVRTSNKKPIKKKNTIKKTKK